MLSDISAVVPAREIPGQDPRSAGPSDSWVRPGQARAWRHDARVLRRHAVFLAVDNNSGVVPDVIYRLRG
jgi:hypothetical protein